MTLSEKKLEELKKRIDEHFRNELYLMKDMIEAHLTKDEIRELNEFMLKHPFSTVSTSLQKKAKVTVQH